MGSRLMLTKSVAIDEPALASLTSLGLGGEDKFCSRRPACFRKRYRQPTHISSVTGFSRFTRKCAYDNKHA